MTGKALAILIACIFGGIGAYLYWVLVHGYKGLVPVQLLVTNLTSSLDAKSRSQMVVSCRVKSGPHEGKTGEYYLSKVNLKHDEGEIVDGWFDPERDLLIPKADLSFLRSEFLKGVVVGVIVGGLARFLS